MRFLDTLVNVVGIPILYIGTSKIYTLFCPDKIISFRTVRRIATGFYSEIDRYQEDDPFWKEMVIIYWQNLLCVNDCDPSKEIFDLLYKKTQGVPAILEYLMTRMNTLIADHGIEAIDSTFIKDIYKTQLIPLHEAVAALAVGDTETYDDLYPISKLLIDSVHDDEEQPSTKSVNKNQSQSSSSSHEVEVDLSGVDADKEMSELESLLPE